MRMPVHEVRAADQELLDELKQRGIDVPADLRSARAASPQDVKLALAELPNAEVSYRREAGGWFAAVTVRDDCCGREGFTAKFHFEKSESDYQPQDFLCEGDSPIPLLWVLQGVSRLTGPLVLISEGGDLAVITAAADIFVVANHMQLG